MADLTELLDIIEENYGFSRSSEENAALVARLRALVAADTPDGATPPDVIERAAEVICGYRTCSVALWANTIAKDLAAANLLAASSPAVTAAERDVIDAALAEREAFAAFMTAHEKWAPNYKSPRLTRLMEAARTNWQTAADARHDAVDRLAAGINNADPGE